MAAASYAADPGADTAEFAVVVDHDDQSHGLGTLLLESLVATARSRGLTALTADVLATNPRMLRALTDLGLPLRCERDDDVLHVTVPLADTARYGAAVDTRDRSADLLTLEPLLRPRSVVVVGAGRSPHSVGHAVLRNLLHGGFTGDLAAVNPHAREVLGVRSHQRVRDLPFAPDLAVVCVPADAVVAVVRDCAEHGVRAVVVTSSGLSARPGAADALRALVRTHGMRMVGPNCVGVLNTDPATRLDATFLDRVPPPGRVGVVTQSGGVAIALAHDLGRVGCGISAMVSLGDKFDVSANDLLHWWTADEGTGAVVAYLESFGNPRRFARLAAALARRKPLVVIRAGISAAGVRAAGSHTAALTSPPVAVAALYRHTGATAVDGIAEAVDVLTLFTTQPLPAAPRVAIVSNAGGIGVLAADACARHGLTVAELHPGTRAELSASLPAGAAVGNPVDTTAVVEEKVFTAVVARVAADDGVDAVVALTVPTALGDPAGGLGPAARAARECGVPLLFVRPGQAVGVMRETRGAWSSPSTPTWSPPCARWPTPLTAGRGWTARRSPPPCPTWTSPPCSPPPTGSRRSPPRTGGPTPRRAWTWSPQQASR
ncbi:GNAT family N-acetyltransferase [Actinokineospora sp. PR83]|nr:GNAT family N-acetyltransferase [Actinokineospora sp. PR83]